MTRALTPCPALAHVLADLAHDFQMRAYEDRLTLTQDEAALLVCSLTDLSVSARGMSETFARVVRERDQLLAIASDAELVAITRAPHLKLVEPPPSKIVDLTAYLAQRPGGAA